MSAGQEFLTWFLLMSHWECLCAQFMPQQFSPHTLLLKPTEHFKTSATRNRIKLKRLIQRYNSIVCAGTSFQGVRSPIISVCQCFAHWKWAAITSGRETNEGHFCTAALSDMSINSQKREEQHRWIFLSQPDKQRDTSEFSLRVESVRQNETSYAQLARVMVIQVWDFNVWCDWLESLRSWKRVEIRRF